MTTTLKAFQSQKTNLKVNMHTTEMTKFINSIGCFYILYIYCQNESDSNLPSRLEIGFRSDRVASILALKISTCMMVTRMFNVCNHDQHATSKPKTIANLSELPSKQYISVLCFSSIKTMSRQFVIPLAVADNEYSSF